MNFVVEVNETMLLKQRELFVDDPQDIVPQLLDHLKQHCTPGQQVDVKMAKTDHQLVRCVCDYVPRHPYDFSDANITMDDLAEIALCFIDRVSVRKDSK